MKSTRGELCGKARISSVSKGELGDSGHVGKWTQGTRLPEAMASARAAFRKLVPGLQIWTISGEVGSMVEEQKAPNEKAELRTLTVEWQPERTV